MTVHVAALFLSLIAGYSAGPSISRNENPTVVHGEGTKVFDCADPNGYSLLVARDMVRDADDVSIMQGEKVLKTIKLPGESEVNGFSLGWAKKTKAGFEIAIDYGTRIYYHKRFVFICKQRRFYLSRVIVESFDKLEPVKTKSGWEFRIKTKVIKVSPNLPLEKFIIDNYFEWPILRPGAVTPAPNNGMQRAGLFGESRGRAAKAQR